MGVVDVAHDRRDFLCRLLTCDTGFQPSNHHELVVVNLGHLFGRFLVVCRKEDLHLLLRESKPARHHANDDVGFGIKIDFAADDGRVAAEAAFPKSPTEDDGTVGRRLVVLRREGASTKPHLGDLAAYSRTSSRATSLSSSTVNDQVYR